MEKWKIKMENLVNDYYRFWKNKRVLITGNAGFKGSWLTLFLKQFDANIVGYSLPPNFRPNFFDYFKKKKINIKSQNINEFTDIQKTIISFKPQIIFHLAAQAIVSKSYECPYDTFYTNVIGTLNLLEVIKDSPPKILINITSDKCYQNFDNISKALKETDPLGGDDPYSASKACSEIITNAYRKSFFSLNRKTNIATVRAGNVIGGGDWSKDRLIPDMIRSIQNKSVFRARDIQSTRPWQHVLDITNAYVNLAYQMYKTEKYVGSWNFGPSGKSNKSVSDILAIAKKRFPNLKVKKIISKFNEKKYLSLDSSKAKKMLQWKTKYNFSESVNKTFDWYDQFALKTSKPHEITINQIKEYMSK